MNCMKCGREIEQGQVFCQECLLDMEKYPVKPGTAVQLPRRRETTVVKKTRRRANLSLEEQVKLLKKRVRLLTISAILLLALVAALLYPAVSYMLEAEHILPGQNYSAVTSALDAGTD